MSGWIVGIRGCNCVCLFLNALSQPDHQCAHRAQWGCDPKVSYIYCYNSFIVCGVKGLLCLLGMVGGEYHTVPPPDSVYTGSWLFLSVPFYGLCPIGWSTQGRCIQMFIFILYWTTFRCNDMYKLIYVSSVPCFHIKHGCFCQSEGRGGMQFHGERACLGRGGVHGKGWCIRSEPVS